jgi:spore coat polysaccharide biosynthesis predicted glycosyltransferase SpsG
MNVLIIIPASGASKDIPRKNIRSLNGKPLIYYSIKNSLSSSFIPDVYVVSEDSEILMLAHKFGAKTFSINKNILENNKNLNAVIFETVCYAEKKEKKEYDFIVIFHPSSPLLKFQSVDNALKKMQENTQVDSIVSGKEENYLIWKSSDDKLLFEDFETNIKVNSSVLYKENGGFLVSKREIITLNNRIGFNIEFCLLNNGEDIDIQNTDDWNLCEYLLKRKKILFVVCGNSEIGLGHVYNTLIIANDILNHHIEFLVDDKSEMALKKIASKNYTVTIQKNKNIIDDIKLISPDLIINDKLDTSKEYIQNINQMGFKCINFEDLGEGSKYADLVFNAIYSEKEKVKNHYFGQDYFILRDEFLFDFSIKKIGKVEKVLLTFGGVDPCNLTLKVLKAIYKYCHDNNIILDIVAGIGYNKFDTLLIFENINIHKNVLNISNFMFSSDVVFTSAGRTIYEIASLGVPSIVLAQNNRELTHLFASKENGFINMGLGVDQNEESILEQFLQLINSHEDRVNANKLMLNQNLKKGRKRVNFLINNLIESI